jgi:hypothetical protein
MHKEDANAAPLRFRSLRPREQLQILRFPSHRSVDAIAPTGVIEEDKFFDRAGAHLSIFAKMDRRLRETVRLATRVQSVHVGFVLQGARKCVRDGSNDEAKDHGQQKHERENRRVTDTPYPPFLTPALKAPEKHETQTGKR